jgi:hypothetical protein
MKDQSDECDRRILLGDNAGGESFGVYNIYDDVIQMTVEVITA